MSNDINLATIDTSYWHVKDKVWMAARQQDWAEVERELIEELDWPKRSIAIIKQYYLKGKMPNWVKIKEADRCGIHLNIFYFILFHPSWDEAVLTPLRDAYMASDLIVEGDISIGFNILLSNSTTGASSVWEGEDHPRYILDTGGHNELLFKILMGNLSNTCYEIQGYPAHSHELVGNRPKDIYQIPKLGFSEVSIIGEWLNHDKIYWYNEDMLLQYDQPLEWWYQCCANDNGYFEIYNNRRAMPFYIRDLRRIYRFDTEKEGDTCRTRCARKIRKILDEREFPSEFKQMWLDVKAGKFEIDRPWEKVHPYRKGD